MADVRKGKSRLISLQVPYETLKHDLENLRLEALNLGASMAETVPAQWAEVDERVRLKCAIPLCSYYGACLHCPPNGFQPDFIRAALKRYSWAILFAIEVTPVEHFAGDSTEREAGLEWSKKCMEIAAKVETLAFGQGYRFALGLAQSCCLKVLCHQDRCLVLGGGKCPYPLKSRPSVESLGIDVYRLVTQVGWDIYPIYRTVDPKEVPRALTVGIIFVD